MKPGQKPIAILLADDDEDDRLATAEAMLRNRLGNELHTVADGEQLLAFLRKEGPYANAPRPGLILLDLNMPKMDGREALREIKNDPSLRAIPVVVLTTSSLEEDIFRSYDMGANSFISKPVTFDRLVRVIADLDHYWFQLVEGAPAP